MPSISLFIVLVIVHVSPPYSKILSSVERRKLIFGLRDGHCISCWKVYLELFRIGSSGIGFPKGIRRFPTS